MSDPKPVPTAGKAEAKEAQREKLQRDVAAFLANGGEIHQATFEDTAMYRELQKKRAKRSRAQHHAEINQRTYQQRHPGAAGNAGHVWRTEAAASGRTL